MAKDDGKLKFDSTIETKTLSQQLEDLKKKLNKFGICIKGISNIGDTITGLRNAFGMLNTAFTTINQSVKETLDLYKKQATAEKQLEVAARNNPYLDSTSVSQLKDYASQLQSISTTGDEELLPFMAELASAGRTQKEIQDIMSAALDASASGAIDLGSAVQSLNRSYSGEVGMLGRVLPNIKNLTEEELKQGGAVEAVKKAYDGMAKEVSESTGSAEKLHNAFGDLKEVIGKTFNDNIAPVQNFFSKIIQGWADAAKAKQNYDEAKAKNAAGKGDVNTLSIQLEEETKTLEAMAKAYANAEDDYNATISERGDQTLRDYKKSLLDQIEAQKQLIKSLDEQKAAEESLAQAQKAKNKAEAEAAQKDADEKKRNTDAAQLIKDNTTALNKQIAQISAKYDLQAQEGQTVDEQAKKQEILNAKEQAYIDLITTDTSLVTANNSAAKARLEDIKAGYEDLATSISENDAIGLQWTDDEINGELQNIADLTNSTIEDTIDAEKDYLDDLYALDLISYEQYTDAKKKLDDEWAEASLARTEEVLNTAASFVNNMTSTLSSISDMVTQRAEADAEIQTAALEKQYAAGEVSEEEYYAKKEEIEKDAAEKEYKIQMWEWSASLLQIGVNTAQAITEALKTSPAPVGLALASTMGILGAAQLAAAIANKPVPPSYATGGIVGGNSYSGDKVQANVNSGEMILNAQQQMALWKAANGGGGTAGNGINLQVKNYMGGQANVSSQLTSDGLKLIIRQTVASDMASGKMNSSFLSAQNSLNGQSYSS